MALNGQVLTAPDGIRGFDANCQISAQTAAAFFAHGYRFCVRYVRRETVNSFDLSADEAAGILGAGLGLMIVQHVTPGVWAPTPANGTAYGQTAASECVALGLPAGVSVWLDLESVSSQTPAADVISYCNNWHAEVAAPGFVPGLYVGDSAGLGPKELYQSLGFDHYWGAYNLNRDAEPAVRGLQMRQRVREAADLVPGYDFEFQTDTIEADEEGGSPALLVPSGWSAT